jgi:hypothetical protein
MDSTLEYILSDARGLLLLHPFLLGATAASRGPERALFIRCGEPPGTFDQGSSLPWVIERGRGRMVVKSRLPALIVGWRSDGVDHS